MFPLFHKMHEPIIYLRNPEFQAERIRLFKKKTKNETGETFFSVPRYRLPLLPVMKPDRIRFVSCRKSFFEKFSRDRELFPFPSVYAR